MSIESCTDFLRTAYASEELMRTLRAMTGPKEIIALGRRHGYDFHLGDLATASMSFAPESAPGPRPAASPPPSESVFYHHEYDIADLPGFGDIIDLLPRLKVQPDTVDLARFADRYREEDRASTDLSPVSQEFRRWQNRVEREESARGADPQQRGFHLVNLDEHVDHSGYDSYLDAKSAAVGALERAFGTEVRFSGSMWYPPSSYRLWHTNETQPGWRMYLIDFDAPFTDPEHTTFFRYLHPRTGELVTLRERPRIARFFKIEQDPDRLFWHCIVNPTQRHRWSFGFVVPDDWRERLGLPA
ncbi:Nif11-like leader peptide family natural product precursor [Marinactinospora thermotolerans]|uniref:Nif11 domain-containing protein n=2 Tax=Marinactinospora thermotolerans TaxID=531310 RepID=A0A1T4SLA6_9ACTN|nr:Nif11-like leader peptide family natural product precursor [Marinactinospora thermotolerans]ARW80052.1 non-heme FeII-dependent hydroxylase [Marinactinospora thermotolerans]SKA28999.1 Nitrogen fixation protein of unknown function [Marinactinospora thermotolerans DSM 45154]